MKGSGERRRLGLTDRVNLSTHRGCDRFVYSLEPLFRSICPERHLLQSTRKASSASEKLRAEIPAENSDERDKERVSAQGGRG